jgi:hypothetical protein
MATKTMDLVLSEERGIRRVTADDFMPLMSVQQAVDRKKQINQFIAGVMTEGEDYGQIPGTSQKKVLLKPGAEKLCSIFGLSVTYAEDKIIEDWTGAEHGGEPLFYYSYRCQLSRDGRFMGEAIGSCNSWESKYRYRWIPDDIAKQRADFDALPKRGSVTTKFEPTFALDKRETGGQYGKPVEYWALFDEALKAGTARFVRRKLGKKEFDGLEITMDQTQYRVPNPEIADTINTCQKMGQKRALVAVVLIVTNCSDAFTQDIEDFVPEDSGHAPHPSEQAMGSRAAEHSPDGPIPDSGSRPPASTGSTGSAGSTVQQRRAFPTEILHLYEKVQKNRALFPKACEALADMMIQKAGKAGEETYARCADQVTKKYPKGLQSIDQMKDVLIDLYDAFSALPGTSTPFDERMGV